jgi:hypothetical protein
VNSNALRITQLKGGRVCLRLGGAAAGSAKCRFVVEDAGRTILVVVDVGEVNRKVVVFRLMP